MCLAVGAGAARDLEVPGRELAGIHLAMDYLTHQNQAVSGEGAVTPVMSAEAKHVVIIGCGDTGSDCLGTAHRQDCIDAVQLELLPQPPSSRSEATPWPGGVAAGDARRGASLIVWAIAEGRKMAASVEAYLRQS